MIVLISESLLLRSTATDGRILRDRVLSGFGVRLNARKRTFLVATSVRGKQFRMMLGYWPLMSVEKPAVRLWRCCASVETVNDRVGKVPQDLPTLREAYIGYCKIKGIKPSSQRRYESFYRTHFGDWLDQPVDHMGHGAFAEHCWNWSATVTLVRAIQADRAVEWGAWWSYPKRKDSFRISIHATTFCEALVLRAFFA